MTEDTTTSNAAHLIEYTYLHANNDGIEIEDWFPIFSEDVQTDIAFQIDVRVVDLLCALHLGGVVGICRG